MFQHGTELKAAAAEPGGRQPATTGRYILILREESGSGSEAVRELRDKFGIQVVHPGGGHRSEEGRNVLLEELQIVVVELTPEQIEALGFAPPDWCLGVFPEGWLSPLADGGPDLPWRPGPSGIPADYLRGYREGVRQLVESLLGAAGLTAPGAGGQPFVPVNVPPDIDESRFTWGLQAIGADKSNFLGERARVAVLDTGVDLDHPDLEKRVTKKRSFVPGEDVQDRHGHGTAVCGIVCGPLSPSSGPRYGVAPEAELYVGKVLSDAGVGTEGSLLEGIEWALQHTCHVICIAAGAPADGWIPRPQYERAWRRALERQVILIAGAGQTSRRSQGILRPVEVPANSSGVCAVAAVDWTHQAADFSNAGLYPPAGAIDLAAPGVAVLTAASRTARILPPAPGSLYTRLSGTSLAAAHTAGVAALLSAARDLTGMDLLRALRESARPLRDIPRDVGRGLVQAP